VDHSKPTNIEGARSMSALIASVVSTWMCLGCNADAGSAEKTLPVNVLIADQKTDAPRISDTPETARKQRKGTVDRLVKFRVLEDKNFARRADILAHRMTQRIDEFEAPETIRPATGAAFLDALVSASRQGPIRNLVVYGHAGSASLYMMEDRGFYRSVSEVAKTTQVVDEADADKEAALRKLGARDLHDFEMLVRSGDIRFAADAVVVFTGCAVAGEKDIDTSGIAARFAEITGATVIASLGVTDQSIAARRGRVAFDEYSRGTWVRFIKGAEPEKLGTRALDPLSALGSAGRLAPFVYQPIQWEASPPIESLRQYWCAASTNDLACGAAFHATARIAANVSAQKIWRNTQ
jgi:hypothetical protein